MFSREVPGMKKRTKILALFLTAGWIFCALCGFTCVPPED